MLRIEPEAVYNFMTLYRDGAIRLTGTEPSITDVLQEKAVFKAKKKKTIISRAMFSKIISALTSFSKHQANMLNEPVPASLRDYKPLNELEAMMESSDPGNSKR